MLVCSCGSWGKVLSVTFLVLHLNRERHSKTLQKTIQGDWTPESGNLKSEIILGRSHSSLSYDRVTVTRGNVNNLPSAIKLPRPSKSIRRNLLASFLLLHTSAKFEVVYYTNRQSTSQTLLLDLIWDETQSNVMTPRGQYALIPQGTVLIFRGGDDDTTLLVSLWLSMIHDIQYELVFLFLPDIHMHSHKHFYSSNKEKGRAPFLFQQLNPNRRFQSGNHTLTHTYLNSWFPICPVNNSGIWIPMATNEDGMGLDRTEEEKVANGENIKCANCVYAARFVAYHDWASGCSLLPTAFRPTV